MTEARYSFTAKVGPKGDLFTVRGDSIQEFGSNLEAVADHAQLVAEALAAVQAIGESTPLVNVDVPVVQTNVAPPAPPAAPGWGAAPAAAPSAPPAAFAAASVPSCQHGPRTPRSGQSAKGPWKSWFCPTAKGTPGQCEPIFLDRKSPEWDAFPA
jgi:hypothetical protein